MQPLRVFIGYDHRQPIAYTALSHSILSKSSKPVSIIPLVLNQLPIKRQGLTPFTFSRFLVPWLCDYKGWALFLDIDIILNDDISGIFDLVDDRYNVCVSKNTKQFEWSSVMLFNNEKCKILSPEYVETANGLHQLEWCTEEKIGDLPREWNHLVGYDQPSQNPKLIHYTQGIPAFFETDSCEHADLWGKAARDSVSATSWVDLMGASVHAGNVRITEEKIAKVPLYYFHTSGESILPEFREKVKKIVEAKHDIRT
jgi:lipopolysaccharide biosynthesis glycosyltransferase